MSIVGFRAELKITCASGAIEMRPGRINILSTDALGASKYFCTS